MSKKKLKKYMYRVLRTDIEGLSEGDTIVDSERDPSENERTWNFVDVTTMEPTGYIVGGYIGKLTNEEAARRGG